ncbi:MULTISPECIES: outer membrane beta-barrel protein [unclassified Mesorhizobium]|uniref:outer membrane protein n=1 Tax=unclassified Mesorhizobium TaxID=325217 RepID=UPI0004CEB686|nr:MULTISPECIES: outer membrane beta-barrel protein [unclassified Mesorhizobium]WJI78809.1 outer membrane beta-barrel protein [Mesorhizobium sp. C374B]WJI85344.1 outer membrane beta-barrel protein [Mesorhizobium sp. C372A]
MKQVAVAAAIFLAATGSAWSADILEPAAPVSSFNWSGLYVGAQGGYSWVDSSITFPGFPGGFEGNPSPNAFSLGGQAGYRYQFDGGVVVGVEGDIYSYFNKEDAAQLNSGPNGESITVNYGGSLRGQVGYAFDRFLPYVTGGLAFIDYSGGGIGFFPGPIVAGTDFSETKAGWTVGAGLAYAITDHFVANVDYRYSDYGSTTFATPFAGVGTTKVDLKENAVKFALSYKF